MNRPTRLLNSPRLYLPKINLPRRPYLPTVAFTAARSNPFIEAAFHCRQFLPPYWTQLPKTMASIGENSLESDAPAADDFVLVPNSEIANVDEPEPNSDPDDEFSQSAGLSSESVAGPVDVSRDTGGSWSVAEDVVPEPRRVLPEALSKSVVFLQCESSSECGTCDVYVVGTAHVSQESCQEVQAVIKCLKPQVVFLELCSSRVGILTLQTHQVPTMNEMFDMWKKKKMNTFGILYSWFLAKVAHKLEVLPGSEFRVAYEEAISYGAKVILGDRPVNITLRRTWGKMRLWHRAKFISSLFFQAIFLPSPEDLIKVLKDTGDVDMLTYTIQEMSKAFPSLMETLLYERDQYMSSTLLAVAREHRSVVAVVGKGHLSGIKKHWKQPIEMKRLLEIPPSRGTPTMKILPSLGVAVTAAAIIYGIYLASKRNG